MNRRMTQTIKLTILENVNNHYTKVVQQYRRGIVTEMEAITHIVSDMQFKGFIWDNESTRYLQPSKVIKVIESHLNK